jgi:hypothetical protein
MGWFHSEGHLLVDFPLVMGRSSFLFYACPHLIGKKPSHICFPWDTDRMSMSTHAPLLQTNPEKCLAKYLGTPWSWHVDVQESSHTRVYLI